MTWVSKLLRIGKGANLDGCDTRYYMRQSGRQEQSGMSVQYSP